LLVKICQKSFATMWRTCFLPVFFAAMSNTFFFKLWGIFPYVPLPSAATGLRYIPLLRHRHGISPKADMGMVKPLRGGGSSTKNSSKTPFHPVLAHFFLPLRGEYVFLPLGLDIPHPLRAHVCPRGLTLAISATFVRHETW
jgi:hypothetical protein